MTIDGDKDDRYNNKDDKITMTMTKMTMEKMTMTKMTMAKIKKLTKAKR